MYIKLFNANNKIMIAVIIITIFLIFPIYLKVNFCFLSHHGKVYFIVKLFNVITLLNGYINLYKGGIAIHISDTKVLLIKYKSLLNAKKTFKPLFDYHVIKVNSKIEFGGDDLLNDLRYLFMIKYFYYFLSVHFNNIKPYLKLTNSIEIMSDKIFNFYCKTTTIFNILMVICSILKILTEKVLYYVFQKAK